METSTGIQTNAVYGFVSSLLNTIKELKPQYVAVASETGPSFRKEQFAGYKATRTWREDHPDEAEELDKQAEHVNKILNIMKIPVISSPTFEADDVIGSIAEKFSKEGVEIIIISNDMDMLQLVTNFVKVYRPARPPFVKKKIYTRDEIIKSFGFGPDKVPDYKALRGDPSDNIPGVKGIGEVTAKKLIDEYGNIENIYDNIENIPEAIRTKLAADKDSSFMSKELSLIKRDISIENTLKDMEITDFNKEEIKKVFKEYEFKSLIAKIATEGKTEENQIGFEL